MSAAPPITQYETVIGLEVHVQLRTVSKLFCDSPTTFGAEPNSNTCEVCLGLPGVLPVINEKAIEFAIMLGLALDCKIAPVTRFDRKHYFYPDLPKAYQISQLDHPICGPGQMVLSNGRTIRINRAHLEEDAGKLVHVGADGLEDSLYSLVDLNRAGVPLLEIVSEPDLRTGAEAKEYLSRLRDIVMYLGICDGNLEEGSMRCDANISVRPVGTAELGVKTELKNMNSLSAIEKAIEAEAQRQIEVIGDGGEIRQETRLWNDATQETQLMRVKEGSADYRYFPDPDLPVIKITPDEIKAVKQRLPELPEARRNRYESDYALPADDIDMLIDNKELGDFLDATVQIVNQPKAITNWLMGDITAYLKTEKKTLVETKLSPANLAALVRMLEAKEIGSAAAKKILPELIETGETPQNLVEAKGLGQINDESALRAIVKKVLDANPTEVEAYKGGKKKLMGFFMGQVMRESKGSANATEATRLIQQELEA